MKRVLIISICLVGCICLAFFYLSFRNQRIKSQVSDEVQSIKSVSVLAQKVQINAEWTEHMRTDWFSVESAADASRESVAMEYGMNEKDVRSFQQNYMNYAILDIQGVIHNASKVKLDRFSYAFSDLPAVEGIWINSDYLFEENVDAESGRTIPFCGKIIIDLERHSEDEYILLLKRCGLNMRFRYETADQQELEGSTSFVFN